MTVGLTGVRGAGERLAMVGPIGDARPAASATQCLMSRHDPNGLSPNGLIDAFDE
jgi:hypothetical protein